MRWFVLSSCLLFLPVVCPSQVLLNEIYYDHPGSDEGYEFVELVNLAQNTVVLAGYSIEFHDGSSAGWVMIWEAGSLDTIESEGLFVVGGAGVVPPPDAVDELGLQNGPDAVRLVFEGGVVDIVGYGSLGDAGSYEAEPAPDVASGLSLARVPDGQDTDNNLADFAPGAPSPGRFNVARRDVALRLAGGTPARDARTEPGTEALSFSVVNVGVETVDEGSVTLEFADSIDEGFVTVRSQGVPPRIAPGDSVRVDCAVDLGGGYHRIRASALWTRDERPENNSLSLFRRVGWPVVIVSEVMSYPRDGCPEYIELFNSGAVPYDLDGHSIRDAAHAPETIVSKSTMLPAEGFAVLTSDASALLKAFPRLSSQLVIEIEGQWPSLNQTGSADAADSVIVLDPVGIPVERVAYPPQAAETWGRSLERVDLFPGRGPHTWALSLALDGGSPGTMSPLSRGVPLAGRGIDVSPNPFDPYRSEILVVAVPASTVPERVVVNVFALDGHRVAGLGSSTVSPSTFVWDGRDTGGGVVLPGIYVLSCEFFSESTGSRRVEKVVVGCGKKSSPGANR